MSHVAGRQAVPLFVSPLDRQVVGVRDREAHLGLVGLAALRRRWSGSVAAGKSHNGQNTS